MLTVVGKRSIWRILIVAILAMLAGAAFGMWTGDAHAYARREGGCDGLTNLSYNFSGSGWTSARQGYFTNGANDWDSIRHPSGGYLVSSSTGGSIEIYIDNYGAGGGGVTSCDAFGNLNSITFDPFDLTSNQFRAVSGHEAGHAHGLDHTGPYDSFDSDIPTMTAGCALDEIGETYDDQVGPEQDDYASLTTAFVSDYHANDSFERGSSRFWGKGGGASLAVYSGGSDGSRYVRMYGYGGYMYQTVRIAAIPNNSRARMNHKKYYSSSSGTAWLALYSRQLDYSTDTETACEGMGQYHNNWNFVEDPVVNQSFTYEKGVTVTPSTSWSYIDATTSIWSDASSWDGADVRVYVYNYMKSTSGGSTYLRIDRARIYAS